MAHPFEIPSAILGTKKRFGESNKLGLSCGKLKKKRELRSKRI